MPGSVVPAVGTTEPWHARQTRSWDAGLSADTMRARIVVRKDRRRKDRRKEPDAYPHGCGQLEASGLTT